MSEHDISQPDPWHALTQQIDRHVQGKLGQMMGGMSHIHGALVYLDWLSHLMISPGKQLDVAKSALEDAQEAAANLIQPGSSSHCCTDPRFSTPGWQHWPFNIYAQSFQVMERAWDRAARGVPGVSHKHEDVAAYAARQWMDVFSPSNVPWMNPDVVQATVDEHGMNLVRGAQNWLDDLHRIAHNLPPAGVEAFLPGKNVAITPGKVVFRNHLIELIQYSPSTDKVHAEPILIVPAWIMKYYILDLSPHNSMVKYLVDQGHTVFMISWKNPTSDDRELSMENYRADGVMAAIDTIHTIVPERKIHAVGYCLGGTMLEIAAATMGRDGDERLGTVSLFAAQGDFTEAGELLLFINHSQVNVLEAMMAEQGVLQGSQMAGAFKLLHTSDLVWSRALKDYMLGQRDKPNDLMAWNTDTTRMPARMHSEYLHKLFLHNDLATGRYEAGGAPIWFTDIHVPCFAVGTISDHVAPWKSVYKLHLLPLDLTFVLTSGGHNAGIVSEPGHAKRHFQMRRRTPEERYIAPEPWQAQTPHQEGSWWPAWQNWLVEHSSGLTAPPRMGLPGQKSEKLPNAPGHYVLEH
jgi:polyhydroxyalkanoate synthase subunit PhaC